MHEAGYVHTDIKPTNVMLAKGGRVKIIDFGQSCSLHHRRERILAECMNRLRRR